MTEQTSDSIQRRYPKTPLVGVAAAVFRTGGDVLLVKRGRPPRAGHWGLPGGLLEVGETLRDGVRREVTEECGVDIAVGGIAGVFEPITYDDDRRIEYHYVVVDFWASLLSGEAEAHDDAAAVAWVSMADLNRYEVLGETLKVIQDAYVAWQAQAASMPSK